MQIDSSAEDRLKVAIIGTSGSGKTCFIAAMRWLGECGDNPRFISVGANGDSKKYLDDLHQRVKIGDVPPGTPAEFKLEFSEQYVFQDGKPCVQIDFSMRDFRGGALHDLDADSPLLQSWTQCDLLMVLLDIEMAQKQGLELQDNLRDLSAVLMRNEMEASQKRLAIVLTQADKGGFTAERHSPDAAGKSLDESLSPFIERIKECHFKETRYFLLASIGLEPEQGADGKSRVPEVDGKREWRPFGYEELFDWICGFQKQEQSARFWAWLWAKSKPYVAVVAVLALGGVVWGGVVAHQYHAAQSEYEDTNSTLEQKAAATWKMNDKDRISAIEARIANDSARVEEKSEEASLRQVLSDIRTFFEKAKISEEQRIRIREIESRIAEKLEENLFGRIKVAMEQQDHDSVRVLIRQYRTDQVITRKHREEVNDYDTELTTDSRAKEKLKIASYYVGDVGNISRMTEKLKLIREFNYPDEKDKDAAIKAVAAMEKLMHGSFTITGIKAERLVEKRDTYVLIASGVSETKDLKQYKKDGEGAPVETKRTCSKCPQWNEEEFLHKNLSWKSGQSIRVEWRRDSVCSDKCIASISSKDDWLGLLRILQPHTDMRHDGYGNLNGTPSVTIKCQEFPSPNDDLELIKRYVIPGTYWTEQ